jgi:hypothetical protein
MTPISRRDFLFMSAAAVSSRSIARGTATAAPNGAAAIVRPPSLGQSWRYAKRDQFTGEVVDAQSERVVAVGRAIEIHTRSETNTEKPVKWPNWGAPWLQKYFGLDTSAGPLVNEMQEPWGMVLVDPHWDQLQAYEEPIPLWPSELRPGWSTSVRTYYKIPDSRETMPWQLTMRAERWESISVPAGNFTALRFFNIIDFRFTNVSERTAAQRIEHIWFSPEIGRWVLRESVGHYREDVGYEVTEGSYRWELLEWS